MNLWVDDIRPAPDEEWVVARSYDRALSLLKGVCWDVISLDHDLGEEKTGYDLICWIEERAALGTLGYTPIIRIHSANPVGVKKMAMAAQKIEDLLGR